MPLSSNAVLVAAPPSLHRQGLLATLRETWPHLALNITADALQLPALLRQQSYALLVLDYALTAQPLPRVLAQLHAIRSQQPVLVLTAQRLSPTMRVELLQSGPHLLLPRYTTPHDVVVAVAPWVLGGSGCATPSNETTPTRHHAPPTPFSSRELEVLHLVVADCCNQEIAERLCLSVRTVESHRRALLQKTGAKTLVGLVVQAVREGWVVA
ncbi:helix-turn-helix transcriptional regulator [Solirubrum puertoriconensis]|uniref:HTH luxR-type domain-containing protein n=1 Tax=Solirubrum puertoriconensis TaxID=1751427 RepID=A0A9X0HPP9_SOLP1|nr:response regulator transcription factor [Solirubrum puertoriconensis]KUG09951.1 hypothetical protein ASU33_20605 [Solirubrum puertoriconensis]